MASEESGALPLITARQQWLKRELAARMRRQMTPAERRLWQHLRANRLDRLPFYRQQVIDGFIADFYCHSARLVVEVDGAIHDDQAEYDAERSLIFATRGLLTLRFTNDQVTTDIYAVTKAIRAAALTRLSSHWPAMSSPLP